ncbi:hypothetical protein ACE2AK_18800 [Rahnella perminowiae]|uniref:hypothetical protein n=1 Tax=Rahnella perminowiae TaxID=2816244 RepID=UPI00365451B2
MDSHIFHILQQMVGEGGVIFITEVDGDLSSFANKINAKFPANMTTCWVCKMLSFKKLFRNNYQPKKNLISKDCGWAIFNSEITMSIFHECIITMELH